MPTMEKKPTPVVLVVFVLVNNMRVFVLRPLGHMTQLAALLTEASQDGDGDLDGDAGQDQHACTFWCEVCLNQRQGVHAFTYRRK